MADTRGCKPKVLCSVAIFCIASPPPTHWRKIIFALGKKWGWGERENLETSRQKRWCLIGWEITWHYFSIPEAISTLGLAKKFPLSMKFLCGFNVTVICNDNNKTLSDAFSLNWVSFLPHLLVGGPGSSLWALLRVFPQLWSFLPLVNWTPVPNSTGNNLEGSACSQGRAGPGTPLQPGFGGAIFS